MSLGTYISIGVIAAALISGGAALYVILRGRMKHAPRRRGIASQPALPQGRGAKVVRAGRQSIEISSAQEIGARESQQDTYRMGSKPGQIFSVVCDGMGGMAKGAEAAKLAADVIMPRLLRSQAGARGEAIKDALLAANEAVYALCGGRGGTTAIALVIDSQGLHYGAVGDSRLYLLRDGKLGQLGQDHVFYYDLLRASFTPEEAASHPESEHLTSFIGREEMGRINGCGGPIPLMRGDCVLAATDGVHKGTRDENHLCDLLAAGQNAREIVDEVLFQKHPGQDNLTAVLFRVIS